MTSETKILVFQKLLNEFETEEIKLYCEDMIEQIPNYIFDMPSSTTGKHHNKTQCMLHGQIYHIIMFGTIANYRLGLKYNKEKKFPDPRIRDAIRCTAIFHDALKCGDGTSQYTVHEHPLLAEEWIRTAKVKHDIDSEIKEFMAHLCAAHSGEWTTARRGSKTVLPEPQNEAEIFVHECDYLASRSDIDMTIPEYLNEIFSESDVNAVNNFDVDNYVMQFGKYKGQKIIDVYREHPDYLQWCVENIGRRDVLDAIAACKKKAEEKIEADDDIDL